MVEFFIPLGQLRLFRSVWRFILVVRLHTRFFVLHLIASSFPSSFADASAATALMGTGKKRGRPRKDAAFSPPMSEHMALAASRKGARSSSRELINLERNGARNTTHFFLSLLFSCLLFSLSLQA